MVGCVGKGVGNGVGMSVTGINVDVGTSVGETMVGKAVSVGNETVCFPQADSITRRITADKGFIVNSDWFSWK
jgi:hypothetical protein